MVRPVDVGVLPECLSIQPESYIKVTELLVGDSTAVYG